MTITSASDLKNALYIYILPDHTDLFLIKPDWSPSIIIIARSCGVIIGLETNKKGL